ncbi:hypothetical protein ACO2Q3_25370 [Caulobacter sp. KR2-114]|uniref:hypothetical protein n=1 Tax=Caulobacter sp. KR2-114 TaxID=3400912 RepID=UPI003C028D4D
MLQRHTPFAVTAPLPPRLDSLASYWRGLLRGGAETPFADDLDMAAVNALVSDSFVLGVFEKPERFRMDLAHTPHAPAIEADLMDRFIDEVALPSPLEFLRAQAEATVEAAAPTVYVHTAEGPERSYQRLLLPAWGEGHVKLLLGALEWR